MATYWRQHGTGVWAWYEERKLLLEITPLCVATVPASTFRFELTHRGKAVTDEPFRSVTAAKRYVREDL